MRKIVVAVVIVSVIFFAVYQTSEIIYLTTHGYKKVGDENYWVSTDKPIQVQIGTSADYKITIQPDYDANNQEKPSEVYVYNINDDEVTLTYSPKEASGNVNYDPDVYVYSDGIWTFTCGDYKCANIDEVNIMNEQLFIKINKATKLSLDYSKIEI